MFAAQPADSDDVRRVTKTTTFDLALDSHFFGLLGQTFSTPGLFGTVTYD
jgi:hypothetical protein